ncbi:MAG TPA: D-alanyl-D-alanine carboxypeptidase/D-alanyl-D-alanine-endopeptidase [Gemmatimonadota bacterium]
MAAADVRERLAGAVDAILDARPFDRAFWGVLVEDARTGEVLYERNARRHFVPASNLKLVVTAAALDALGPDYAWRTSLYATGPLRGDGTLEGDLVLYGRGDPNLSGRFVAGGPTAIFEALADSLRVRGLRRVAGGVVADESWFEGEHTRPDWEAYDLLWWYAAPVSALSFNDNSIDFTIRPAAPGSPPLVTGSPPSSFWSLRNEARTVARLDSASVALDFTREPGTNRVTAYGEIAADAPQDTESFAVVNPAGWTGTVFREVLEASGVAVERDSVIVVADAARSPVAPDARPLVEHVSVPLARVIATVNQRSQNLHAELLLKTLGRETRGAGSFDAGIAAERGFLEAIGVAEDAVHLRDASGLSSGNLVTPEAMATLLGAMRRHRDGRTFAASLASPGGEGELRVRFADRPELAGLHAKTGYIRHVNTLSGYLVPSPGDTLVFSILSNNHGLPRAQAIAAIDSVVATIARERARGAPRTRARSDD